MSTEFRKLHKLAGARLRMKSTQDDCPLDAAICKHAAKSSTEACSASISNAAVLPNAPRENAVNAKK